ncbi:MAG: CHC2 zinc finger domain-containing protein [Anaerolineae bacterium]|nr:CHC2 zinc finger domain-containing protein [Anaerolineae bacterium]NUQ03912.1 toprim domain-containing protein [Anaerolineae bacterium]
MSFDLEQIRSRNPIEEVIAEKFALKKSGSRFIGVEHDSLVVVPNTGFYFWNSQGEHGDVFDFVGRHLLSLGAWNNRDATHFMEVVRYLAQRAGITLEENINFKKSSAWAERQLMQRLHDSLLSTPAALTYVTDKRGWRLSTVKAARLGYMPQDKRPLLADLNLSDNWRTVMQKFPSNMIVYIHTQQGRLTYLSGRSIEGKKHYNPPRDIIGERQPYYNHLYSPEAEQIVIVEGQADAITFAEWGIAAVAIGGMQASDELLKRLKAHPRLFVALDNTEDARAKSRSLALTLKGETYLPALPAEVKDVNEWLQKGAVAEDALALLNKAESWLATEVQHVAALEGLARQDAIRALFTHAAGLDDFVLAEFKSLMAKIGVKGRAFSEMFKAAQSQQEQAEGEDMPEVLSDSIPILSPALGFRRDVAMVTVSVIERTKDNKLNTQPYLVTSTRELRRLSDEQIITISNQEVALKVIPDGSEFLMRWRYTDIRRYLEGETIQPGAVFAATHDLFKTYVDFRSDIESRLLTLWTIGTYFYTMFPAYPYLALNGPKNSGKSTVMRVLQPLAFNMITTSDPTGPSMFRLIHQTSCTVGIDEAERYHNPKDPGMQQIRQLLNSGYKQGMPAIRVTGDDLKPQAFDVYSPKILAAIMGLEDILASRCIAIPMRRTTQKMPSFPPDFDGALLRHQLYTLALTHFQAVYRNYFERPELHKLHNRSGELWSPLVALAAFFEEQGGVIGLLDAISNAAEWDEQISEGKSLNEREEAVLQALELLTRNANEVVWLKGTDLREEIRSLLGHSSDEIGNAQWIGHILKRLQLIDQSRRKHHVGGKLYAIERHEVLDMMQRYDVPPIENSTPK